MAYDRHIDKTEEELRDLRAVYAQDDVARFIDGLESGNIKNEEQIIALTNKIQESDGLVRLEYSRLLHLKQSGFIEQFATNCNKRYDTAHFLMNKMRSGLSRGLKLLETFCEKKRRKGHSKSKRKVVDNSKMGRCAYNLSIWRLEQYKESVKKLYQEVCSYNDDLTKCIDLCLEMIDQVKYVRTHPDYADEIYDKCRKETVLNSRTTIRRFISLKANLENDIYAKMEEWERKKLALKNLKAKLYHTLDLDEWTDLCVVEEVIKARQQDVTNEERALWGDNKQKVRCVRVVYEHLDELTPKGQKGMIGGMFLARLYRWSNVLPKRGLEYWYEYFIASYERNGQLKPAKCSAIKTAKGQIAKLDNSEDKQQQADFNEKIDMLLKKHMIEQQYMDEQEKEAVNF
jgi:hypothetical protein